ncbi:hypothetical protein JCM10369A_22860 [Nocardioides pyridinolyticus]
MRIRCAAGRLGSRRPGTRLDMSEPEIQKVEVLPEATEDTADVDDVPEEHLNRPD